MRVQLVSLSAKDIKSESETLIEEMNLTVLLRLPGIELPETLLDTRAI